jgi:uncharacterized HAD superfamily protein
MKVKDNSIVAVDLDNTLCEGDSFTDIECIMAKPIQEVIDKVNNLNRKKDCFIVIHTARKEFLREATTYWLRKHEVRYNCLEMNKLWATYYIDDRAINTKDFIRRG